MSVFSSGEEKDVLQPNEAEIDMNAVWRKVRPWFFGVLSVMVIVAFVIWIRINSQERKNAIEAKAQAILTSAVDEQTLEGLIAQYPNSDAATQALLLLASRKYQMGDWAGARGYYAKLASSPVGKQDDWVASAFFGEGMAWEAERKWDEAIGAFTRVTQMYPKSYKAPESKFAIGRVNEEKGDIVRARQVYEDVAVTYPQSAWKEEAQQRLKRLDLLMKASPAK